MSERAGVHAQQGQASALGLLGRAGVVVAVAADRMAHRRRVGAMALAFERAITMPINFLTQKGSGAVVRTILSGTDALFWVWLGFMREHCAALISVLFLITYLPDVVLWLPKVMGFFN